MSWLRLEDEFDGHPKITELTDAEAWRWVRVLLHCARYETDGKVSRAVLKRYGLDSKRDRLLKLGLLEERHWNQEKGEITRESELFVHDFLEFNPSAAEREAERERWRQYKRESRKGANVQGGHSHGFSRESRQSPSPSAQDRSPSPSPKNKNSSSTSDVERQRRPRPEESLAIGNELLTARLLAALGNVAETKADYIRGGCARLPEAKVAGILELVSSSGHVRDRTGYVIGAIRRELEGVE